MDRGVNNPPVKNLPVFEFWISFAVLQISFFGAFFGFAKMFLSLDVVAK